MPSPDSVEGYLVAGLVGIAVQVEHDVSIML